MNQIVSLVEKISSEWFRLIVSSSVQLAIFLSVIGIITFIFRKRSARFLYFLWLIGLFRVFLPTNFDFLFQHSMVSAAKPDFIPTIQIQEIILTPASDSGSHLSTQGYFFLLWLAGVIIFVAYWLFNYVRFRRIIKHDVKPFDLSADLQELIKSSKVKILTGKFIATPFVRGIFRPKIYLPETAHQWAPRELKAILYHELAHIQCKDLLLIVIQNAIQMIYFFHPLVWLANMQIFRYREKARDDLAIEKMGGNGLAYGKYLLTSMDNALEWQPIYSGSHYFLQSKSFLYQRFEYILNRKGRIMNKLTLFQKGVLVGCLIIGFLITGLQTTIRSQEKNQGKAQIKIITVHEKEGQEPRKEIVNGREIIFEAFDQPPEPEGGFAAATQKNLVYPEEAKKAGKTGMVLVYTQIGSDGKIIDAFIGNSTIKDSACEAAALKAVKSVSWKPAMRDGKPIAVWVTVPVRFSILGKGAKTGEVGIPPAAPPSPPPPPPAPQDSSENVIFVPYDKPPMPIGGFAAIQKNLVYPDIARKAGIEGTVIIYAFVNKNGEVERTKVVKPLGNAGCNEAAIEAIKSVKWEPAKQRDKNVGVWVSVPVKFKLPSGKGGTAADLKEAERKLQKVEQDLLQKEKLLQEKQDKKSEQELKKIREDLKEIQENLRQKSMELEKLNEKIKEPTEQAPPKAIEVGDKIFVPYDKPPEPIGGFAAIQKNLVYPKLARENKIEGTVILYVQISEKGEVSDVRVQKPLDKTCNQAAIDAVKSVKWKPAEQKGKPVSVWVSVPVIFRLK